MGTFNVEISIGDSEREHWTPLDALVDTGASITAAPASVLREMGVTPLMRQTFRSAQGEVREMFNDEGTPPLLGALTLEAAFVGVDPVGQRQVPVEGLMMRAGLLHAGGPSLAYRHVIDVTCK